MREQFLEREASLRGMPAGGELIELRFARRIVNVLQRVLQSRQPERLQHLRRNPVAHGLATDLTKRFVDERAYPSLCDAFGAGVNRRQRVFEASGRLRDPPILGMHASRAPAARGESRRSSESSRRARARSAARLRSRRTAA